MAKRKPAPGRTLIVFLLGTALLYGLVALAGSWKPELGLDLQGGTRITLVAKGDPSGDNLEEARGIIDQRVNGSGVSEAEVTTQGSRIINVEIPGDEQRSLVETVQRTAQLRFRLVACSDFRPCQPPAPDTSVPPSGIPQTADPSGQPSDGASVAPSDGASVAPSDGASVAPTDAPTDGQSAPADEPSGTANRVAPGFASADQPGQAAATDEPSDAATDPTDAATDEPSDGTSSEAGTPSASPSTEAEATESFDETAVVPLDDAIAFMNGGYTLEDYDAYSSYQCAPDGTISKVQTAPPGVSPEQFAALPPQPVDNPTAPLVACSAEEDGGDNAAPAAKYLLSPSVIAGTDLDGADFGIPQNEVNYAVTLDIGGDGQDVFAEASSRLVKGPDGDNFAIVLDGEVLSAPYFSSVIPDGSAQISGNFSESEARSLSTSLKYGSLPISFDEPSVQIIGPSLAGDQLNAGLLAGAFGLGLVLLYCLLYYRGLGIVVVASLLAAAAVTYALVLLLSETAGFVLTLPGIAGLIIAVGVTADSFIIFFERIRDEMREGRSMRVAVEQGWKRAKVTRLAAQVVSLLSAAVLYIFATGAVKGFGFALGLTTIVDLAILFWFTKPMVSWLARFHFFNGGGRLSGLSPETLGIDRPRAAGATVAAPAERRKA